MLTQRLLVQGIAWIRKRETKNNLKIVAQSTPRYLDAIENCIQNGEPCLIENLPESLDAVLDPILARSLIRKGKGIMIGDKDVDYDPRFRLYLQTKLSNPHYKPEVAAQTTIVNFMVTEARLIIALSRCDRGKKAASDSGDSQSGTLAVLNAVSNRPLQLSE